MQMEKIHLVSAICKIVHEVVGTSYNYYPYAEGIIYWNEDMDPFEADDQLLALDAWYSGSISTRCKPHWLGTGYEW